MFEHIVPLSAQIQSGACPYGRKPEQQQKPVTDQIAAQILQKGTDDAKLHDADDCQCEKDHTCDPLRCHCFLFLFLFFSQYLFFCFSSHSVPQVF
jgi:hypothetical protein